jgi:hypothetical protein
MELRPSHGDPQVGIGACSECIVGHIIRAAQNKTLAEINWEIRWAVRAPDLGEDAAVQARPQTRVLENSH